MRYRVSVVIAVVSLLGGGAAAIAEVEGERWTGRLPRLPDFHATPAPDRYQFATDRFARAGMDLRSLLREHFCRPITPPQFGCLGTGCPPGFAPPPEQDPSVPEIR